MREKANSRISSGLNSETFRICQMFSVLRDVRTGDLAKQIWFSIEFLLETTRQIKIEGHDGNQKGKFTRFIGK